ncbi:MAG: endonuclease domain-containing protein [Candidatus Wenzhouxiangella sp. M2_3B_020]
MKNLRQRARTLRNYMTDAEQRLWHRLRRKQICNARFRRQHPIGHYIVDFVCLDRKLIVEVDGGQHQGSGYDEARDAWLRAQGFEVLRFWNHDVLQRTDEVVEAIWRWLK